MRSRQTYGHRIRMASTYPVLANMIIHFSFHVMCILHSMGNMQHMTTSNCLQNTDITFFRQIAIRIVNITHYSRK